MRLLKFLCENYLPGWDGNIAVTCKDSMLSRLSSPGLTYKAYLRDTGAGYELIMRSGLPRPEEVVCHEFCHLEQFVRGDLSVEGGTATWKGVKYPRSIGYDSRPWETEAFARQQELLGVWYKHK